MWQGRGEIHHALSLAIVQIAVGCCMLQAISTLVKVEVQS